MLSVFTDKLLYLVYMVLTSFTVDIRRWYWDTVPQQSQCSKWMGLGTQDDQSDKLKLCIWGHNSQLKKSNAISDTSQ
jgi:hypothetical protein